MRRQEDVKVSKWGGGGEEEIGKGVTKAGRGGIVCYNPNTKEI